MAKIWTEPFDPHRHPNRMNWGWGAPGAPEIARSERARTLDRHAVLFVRVCAFTFELHNAEQLQACLAFYARKQHPTSRLAVESGEYGGDQHEVQRWHDRLPMYLREEPKRLQVVSALAEAFRQMETGEISWMAI